MHAFHQDRRLFHTPTPNWSPTTRKVCFVGYGFRWIQPKDGMYVEPAMATATCPVLKQMLGAGFRFQLSLFGSENLLIVSSPFAQGTPPQMLVSTSRTVPTLQSDHGFTQLE
jgi:hypothetical protein